MVKKKMKLTLCAILMIISSCKVCLAGEYDFSNIRKHVDSNSFSYIGVATKDSTSSTAALKVTRMYNPGGGENYSFKKLYARATDTGNSTYVTKGKWVDITIPSSYRKVGSRVRLYCKGNNPSLDCDISGYWNVH